MSHSMELPDPASLGAVEDLYLAFLRDPSGVSEEWRRFFDALGQDGVAGLRVGPSFTPRGLFGPARGNGHSLPRPGTGDESLDARVARLEHAYLVRGHLAARLDPLGRPRPPVPELDPAFHGLAEPDLTRGIAAREPAGPARTVGDLLAHLQATYCGPVGFEFMHLDDPERRRWLAERIDRWRGHAPLAPEAQRAVLARLTEATALEEFIQQKYPGAKSFSLEGSETLIPLLDLCIEDAGAQEVDEIVLAMAHRGRLNVLVNVVGKRPRDVFREFDDDGQDGRSGDVKYHLGHSTDRRTASGRSVHLSLCFNPSHLEYVNPVAAGRVRAKQDREGDRSRTRGMALLVHGDAAFAAEGVTQETLALSTLPGYRIGGALHVVLNNQIGFTTPPEEARSSTYATDVARMIGAPIFHVNGEDLEAVARVGRSDVVVDLYGYRRHGHNEGDEPAFTQPGMYRLIAARPPVRDVYAARLLELGVMDREGAEALVRESRARLDEELAAARQPDPSPPPAVPAGIWEGYRGGPEPAEDPATAVPAPRLGALLEDLARLPEAFRPHPKIARGLGLRREMAAGKRPLDWSAAEALALATLAVEGHPVRLSGQDTARGTFSHRHAVLHDVEDGSTVTPLQRLQADQAPVEILNSPLSEAGVLGFDYGYSLDRPEGLVLWEAQFGDFVNAAQVIVDQFLVSAEAKWRRLSGLVLLLPHGFEGQGPEHSSARLERFLDLAVDDNVQVANPTTPAQLFHLLRRQVRRRWRKPLVVMTPKSLLRHPRAVSPLADLAQGGFRRVLADHSGRAGEVRRVLVCSGKVYYELAERREAEQRTDVALVRLEQLYPLRERDLADAVAPYPARAPAVWVQEEPANMGAWGYLLARFGDSLPGGRPLSAVCRPPSASPAVGSAAAHKREQARLLAEALGPPGPPGRAARRPQPRAAPRRTRHGR
jgi:2-oxoglutarate dehydrogenase E1 component